MTSIHRRVDRMVQNTELTRREAYSVLGRRGAAKRRNRTAKTEIPEKKIISEEMKGVKRGDLVVKDDSKGVFRVLENMDSKGCVLCEDAERHICYFHASKLTLVAVSVETGQTSSGFDELLELLQ